MTARYGPEPIRLNTNDIRRREMMTVGAPDKHLERKQSALNTTITLSVNNHEYDHMIGRLAEIGFLFYAQDKRLIFQFVLGRVTAGLPALHAIKDYYASNGIEDDDHSIETAERQWKRFMADKKKERVYSTPEFVPKNIPVLLSVRQAEFLASRLTQVIDEKMVEIDPRLRAAAAAWVLCDLTPLKQKEVAEKLNRSQGHVSRSVARFRSFLEYSPSLRTWVGYLLRSTHARPTPSISS